MVEISLVELEMHVVAAIGARGIPAQRVAVRPSNPDGGWQIEREPYGVADLAAFAKAAQEVEAELGAKYKVHRLLRGGAGG
jgi:hypothetical protein